MELYQISILITAVGILVAIVAYFWGTSRTENFISKATSDSRNTLLWRDFWIGIILVAFAIIFPAFGAGKYILGQVILFFIWAAVVTQWNLVFGFAGIFTLGHMAVFAVGGYITAMTGLYLGWSLWAALPVGALATVIFSFLMGATIIRLRGPYIAVMTLAIAIAMQKLIVSDVECFITKDLICYNFTGGAKGLFGYGGFGFKEWLGFKGRIYGEYYLALLLLILSTLFALYVIYSPLGSTFRSIRDNEICASSRGVNRVKYQLIVFTLSGIFTGLAGGVFAGLQTTIGPNILSLSLLLFLLSMIVVGGRGTNWGPLIGAAALMLADTVLRDLNELRVAGLSLIILLVMLFLPNGIVGLIGGIFNWRPKNNPSNNEGQHNLKQILRSNRSQFFKKGNWIKSFGDEK